MTLHSVSFFLVLQNKKLCASLKRSGDLEINMRLLGGSQMLLPTSQADGKDTMTEGSPKEHSICDKGVITRCFLVSS